MSTITNKVSLDFGYTNTDFKRRYTMGGVSTDQFPNVETAVNAINASLAAGTTGGPSSTFISDDFAPDQNIGYLQKIERAVIVSTEETPLEF